MLALYRRDGYLAFAHALTPDEVRRIVEAAAPGMIARLNLWSWRIKFAYEACDHGDAAECDRLTLPREAMGLGDVKFMAAIGAFLGWQAVLVALVVSVFAGAIIGLVMLAMKKGNKIPFGPYLAIGAVVALFWGGDIWGAYLKWLV